MSILARAKVKEVKGITEATDIMELADAVTDTPPAFIEDLKKSSIDETWHDFENRRKENRLEQEIRSNLKLMRFSLAAIFLLTVLYIVMFIVVELL